jgi:hypothetical protein
MVIKKKKSNPTRKRTTKRIMSKFPKPTKKLKAYEYDFPPRAICPECGGNMQFDMWMKNANTPIPEYVPEYTCETCGLFVPPKSVIGNTRRRKTTRKRISSKTPKYVMDEITKVYSRYDPRESIPETETTKEGWMADIAMVKNKPYIRVASAGNLDVIDRKIRDFVRGYSNRDKVIILKSKVGKSADPAYSDDLGYAYGIYIPMR